MSSAAADGSNPSTVARPTGRRGKHPTVRAPPQLAAVSVDLDDLGCYWRIHALQGEPPDIVRRDALHRWVTRFADLFERNEVRATFFVVGRNLAEDPRLANLLAKLASAGHELASHTYSHPYDLVRRPRAKIADELDRAHEIIAATAGRPTVGFRAPGYELSADLVDLLVDRSYLYDSSVFPSWPYYGAKALVMAMMRATGRRSGSVLGKPAVLAAPATPYRPAAGRPYQKGHLPILELPVAVTQTFRLPVIGTSLIALPGWVRRLLLARAVARPLFNLELHGIDVADAENDELPASLVARQPDLRRSLAHKTKALESALAQIRATGARFVTLAEATRALTTGPHRSDPAWQ